MFGTLLVNNDTSTEQIWPKFGMYPGLSQRLYPDKNLSKDFDKIDM